MPFTDTDAIFKAIQNTKTYKSIDFACYVQKPAWMTRHIGLKGDKLDVFAVVWSMTVNGNDSWYYGGNNFIADVLGKYGTARKSVRRALNNLVKEGYLKRMPRKRPTDDLVVLCYQPDTEGIVKAIEKNDPSDDGGPGIDVDDDEDGFSIVDKLCTIAEDEGAETMAVSVDVLQAVVDDDGIVCASDGRDMGEDEPEQSISASASKKTATKEQKARAAESRESEQEQEQTRNGTKHAADGTTCSHIIKNNKIYNNPSPITLSLGVDGTGDESKTDAPAFTEEGEGIGFTDFKNSEKSNNDGAAAVFNRCIDAAVNKNHSSEAHTVFNDLVHAGYEPTEIEDAWARYQQGLRAKGREPRYFTNMFSWLTNQGVNGARDLMDKARAERRQKADADGSAERVRFITGKNGAQNHVLAFSSTAGWFILPNVDGSASYEEKLAAYRKVAA